MLKKNTMTQNTKSTWKIDSNHSLIQFKVKHLAISNVSGTFNVFKGDVQTESEDFSGAEIQFVLDTNSVDTNNSDRDAHLKSDAFFNAPKFPTISFNGKLHKMEDEYQLEGELTLLETTKVVKLNVEYSGTGKGRFGDQERNAMRGPGYWRTDASLFKKFRLAETKELEFRVESVNVFNHVNLGNPDSFIGSFDQSGKLNVSPTLGSIFTTAVFGADQMRNLQFALKLKF